MKYIGIDLGTTYCCISGMDDTSKEPIVFKNIEGEETTPSVVWYDGTREKYTVGEEAKRNLNVKNKGGTTWVVHKTKRDMNKSNCSITIGEGHGSFVVTPQDVASDILRYLINLPEVKRFIGRDRYKCVITHPETYSTPTLTKVMDAAKSAGITDVDLISEPKAAAISYCMEEKFENGNLLIFDLGGGTLDITLVNVSGRNYRTLSRGGVEALGGIEWDKCVSNEITRQYAQFKHLPEDDVLADKSINLTIEGVAEEVKKTISCEGEYDSILSDVDPGFVFQLDEESFDDITENLILQATGSIPAAVKEAIDSARAEGQSNFKIDRIILVGGSSRMTQVRDKVIDEVEDCIPDFDGNISKFDPSFAISKGATYVAKHYRPDDHIRSADGIGLTELMPQTVGVRIHHSGWNRSVCSNILFKDDVIPCKRKMTYSTMYDNQPALGTDLYTNDTRKASPKDYSEIDDECKTIGHFQMDLPRGVREGTAVYVTVNVDKNGLITFDFECSGKKGSTTAHFSD